MRLIGFRPRLRTPRIAFSLAIVPLAIACSDNGSGIRQLHGQLKTDDAVDFGDVQIGDVAEYDLNIKNAGTTQVTITQVTPGDHFTDAAYTFAFSPSTLALAPSETKPLILTFRPVSEMAMPAMSSIDLATDIADPTKAGAVVHIVVPVKGRGVKGQLIVDPNPVDFGNGLIGSTKTIDVKITNAGHVAAPILSKDISSVQGMGRFEVVSPLGPGGSLLQGGKLDPMLSIVVKLKYTPDPGSTPGQMDKGRWTIANCADPSCDMPVDLIATATNDAMPG